MERKLNLTNVHLVFECQIKNCPCGGQRIKTNLKSVQTIGFPLCFYKSCPGVMTLIETTVDDKAIKACHVLADAYSDGKEDGGGVNWAQVDDARAIAKEAIEESMEEV